MTRRLGSRVLGALLVAAAAWFLVSTIRSNWQALREYEWRIDPPLLIASLVVHVGVLVCGVLLWRRVQGHFGRPPAGRGELIRIWFLSNLARYIPGKVFQFVAVAHLGRGTEAGSGVLLASLLAHTAFSLLAAAVLAGFTLGGQLLPGLWWWAPGLLLAAGAALVVHPALLNAALAVVGRLSRRPLLRWHGRWHDGLALLALSVLVWLLYGVAYHLFLASLTPLPLGAFAVLSGINALSFVAGYLAIVTPGGLGVREAAMTSLLLPLLPPGVAAVLALASRLWTIAAELLGGLLALLVARRERAGSAATGRSGLTPP